jgi:hypothetical protein
VSVQLAKLNFASLAQLDDGQINNLLMLHLQRAAQDCVNRPGEKAKRKITFDFEITPRMDPSTGECDDVHIEILAKTKIPTYRSKTYQMQVSSKGVFFNQDFPEALDQQSLFPKPEEGAGAP